MSNSRYIAIQNANNGIAIDNNGGDIVNSSGGEILVEGTADFGLRFTGNGHRFTNEGLLRLDIDGDGTAFFQHTGTTFENLAGAHLDIWGSADIGLSISNSEFINQGGNINLWNTGTSSLHMVWGELENSNCGMIRSSRRFDMESNSFFLNDAWLEISANGSVEISPGSYLWNDDVIYDPADHLSAFNTQFVGNGGVIINPITVSNASNGTPINNALYTYPSISDININDTWYSAFYGGVVVGFYDQANNVFLPDISGPGGFTTVYTDFEIPGCSSRRYGINIPAGIQARGLAHTPGTTKSLGLTATEELQVFPNPADQQVQLIPPVRLAGELQLELFSLSGQQLLQQTRLAVDGPLLLSRPASLPAGIYLLRLTDESGNQAQQRLVFR